MKRYVQLGMLLGALCGPLGVWADDTPSNMAAPVDRLASPRAAIQAGDWGRAIRELQAQAQTHPRDADVHNLLGYSYRKQAKPDLAKAFFHYEEALKLDPTHQGAHEYIGEAYLMAGQKAKAREHLATLEKLCGNRTCEAYRDLARAIGD